MIFLDWHLGLGDAIACAAIVVKLSKEHDKVVVPCFDHNTDSVKSLFVDIDNVIVVSNTEKQKYLNSENCKVLKLGYYNESITQNKDGEDFVEWFYRQAGMKMHEKEKYCPVKSASDKVMQEEPYFKDYSFVHDDKKRGFIINKEASGYRIEPSNNNGSILKYAKIIELSKEIHCIDSSFIHLVECLNVNAKKFYHKSARQYSTDFKYMKGWEVIE